MSTEVPTFTLELSPMARQTGVVYLHDVYLDAGQELASGDRLHVKDEGGALWDAVVVHREQVRLGHKYRLEIRPAVNG
jgi:hypothetical protein